MSIISSERFNLLQILIVINYTIIVVLVNSLLNKIEFNSEKFLYKLQCNAVKSVLSTLKLQKKTSKLGKALVIFIKNDCSVLVQF